MPVLLAMATALFLAGTPWPEPPGARDAGLAGAAARGFAAWHEAALAAADPALSGPVAVALPQQAPWRQRSCAAGGAVATFSTPGVRRAAILLPRLRRLLGDPPGLGIADGGPTLPGSDRRRHDLPCDIPAGALVLVGRI